METDPIVLRKARHRNKIAFTFRVDNKQKLIEEVERLDSASWTHLTERYVGISTHMTISNAKPKLINIFHDIKPEFLQNYVDEFCNKFNRRYHGEALFNRLLVAAVSCKNEFGYKYG